jgi:hypothetical protein
MDTWGPNADQSYFRGEIYHGFTAGETEIPKKDDMSYEQALAAHGLAPDASRRDTFELDISRTHIKFGMPQYNIWWLDADVSDLGFSQGVIQLGDHSYNPDKACDYNGTCGPDTWHWDNVSISPAAPFTIIKGNQPFVGDSSASKSVTFASPAPANARLRFSAIGKTEVSFNGGATWQLAQKQAQELNDAGHFSSYWMPVPQGTTTVQFRFSQEVDWYSGPYRARNFAIWAPGGTLAGSSGSLQQPTATPTKTQSSGATATPTKTQSSGATATPTQSKPATATPTPTRPPSFTTRASVSKSGHTFRVTGAINASASATILADLEIYGPSGQRVAQQFWDNQALTAGFSRSFTLNWTPPGGSARGTYTVKIGVFQPAWGSLFTWNDRAATFQGP